MPIELDILVPQPGIIVESPNPKPEQPTAKSFNFFHKFKNVCEQCVENSIFETFIIGTIILSNIVLVNKQFLCSLFQFCIFLVNF